MSTCWISSVSIIFASESPFGVALELLVLDLIASGSTSKVLIVVVAAISVSELLSKGAVSAVMTLSGELTSELLLRLLTVAGVVDAFTFVLIFATEVKVSSIISLEWLELNDR